MTAFIFVTGSSDDGIGAYVSRALTKPPATGHFAVIKYSVTVRLDEAPGRTGFHRSRNDLRLSARWGITSFGVRMQPDAEEER